MKGGELDKLKNGSVRAAIDLFGKKDSGVSLAAKESQMHITEMASSKASELYVARSEIGRYTESKRAASSAMEQAELELANAKKTVKYLNSLIEESNSRTNAQRENLDMLKKPRALADYSAEYKEYVKLLEELEKSKQELGKLKLDMGLVVVEKSKLEKEMEAYNKKALSQSSAAQILEKEIEEVNEELVLVELAHIEAIKELSAVEAQRENEKLLYLSKTNEAKKKVSELTEEIERSREIEAKLADTSADIEVLKNELDLIKNIKGSCPRIDGSSYPGEVDNANQLKVVTDQLLAATKKLDTISKESFNCLASIDITRNELKDILEQTDKLKRTEEKVEMKVQALNSKLLRAKSKLDKVSAAEEKANSIVTNLSLSLEKLRKETEAAKREKFTLSEETERMKAEISRFENASNIAEERLNCAIDNLEAVKSSENIALENLQNLIYNIMIKRNDESRDKSFITISKFEYEYLTGRAVGAEEIADKKIAAAHAWIEALNASEKELAMHIEMVRREMMQISIEEQKEMIKTGMEEETLEYEKDLERRNSNQQYPRRSTNVKRISSQQARMRVSGSPIPRATSFNVKKRKNVMPSLAKYFNSKKS